MKVCKIILSVLLFVIHIGSWAGSTSPIGPSGGMFSSAPLGADDFMFISHKAYQINGNNSELKYSLRALFI